MPSLYSLLILFEKNDRFDEYSFGYFITEAFLLEGDEHERRPYTRPWDELKCKAFIPTGF